MLINVYVNEYMYICHKTIFFCLMAWSHGSTGIRENLGDMVEDISQKDSLSQNYILYTWKLYLYTQHEPWGHANKSDEFWCKAHSELLVEENHWWQEGHNATLGTPENREDIDTVNGGGEGNFIFHYFLYSFTVNDGKIIH